MSVPHDMIEMFWPASTTAEPVERMRTISATMTAGRPRTLRIRIVPRQPRAPYVSTSWTGSEAIR